MDAALPNSPIDLPGSWPTEARDRLLERFASRISVSDALSRKLVSYQGNKQAPGLRWLKYKEGFSGSLIQGLTESVNARNLLDPFSGVGTAVITAGGMGLAGTGIEIMPVGNLAARAIAAAANGLRPEDFAAAAGELLACLSQDAGDSAFAFPHVPITQYAFPEATERDLAKVRRFHSAITDPALKTMLTLACVSVLEEVSYTRKDGQFLRWDPQSGRKVSPKLHKESVPTLKEALQRRLTEMAADLPALQLRYGGSQPHFIDGSSLTELRNLPEAEFDLVVTSPPYANRYDYTRTYALELAYLGYDAAGFKELRQSLLSSTVENHSKREYLAQVYGRAGCYNQAMAMADNQAALQEALSVLRANAGALSNRNVINLVENYFTEMALIVAELGRVAAPGGRVFMVNDNVRYHGQEIPVDLILSDFAEQSGFHCEAIWTLKQGKGNSSQQMGRFGRQEIRKCVYHWRKRGRKRRG